MEARTHCKGKMPQQVKTANTMERLLGFNWQDISSWRSVIVLLNRPTDPAGLGIMRFMFGFLMILDIPQERGLSYADVKWGDTMECRFPLFDVLSVPPLEWVYLMYFTMFLGAVGIMVGLFYRLNCLLFLLPYWYLFLLDKSSWNNHSYLYGLMALLFLLSDGNRYWSLDCWRKPSLKNAEVPLWNYTLFRFQIFLLYHIAGLKKFNQDWLGGYSMYKLSRHWVFVPFKFVMSESAIDLYIVHLGGFFLDLTIGFFMFFDVTRIIAFFFCSMFNLMNSQMFHIGMFPYTMLATMTLFCHPAWPRILMSKCFPYDKLSCQKLHAKPNAHCLYLDSSIHAPVKARGSSVGYNTWTNGLYGYSWDMMVHSWQTLHTRVMVVDKETGQKFYLDPEKWVSRDRWTSHADMAKQYASCMKRNLEMYGLTNVSIYMDIWKSLNRRFQQRIFHPDVDILTADWSPFAEVPWVMPLLSDLSGWRTQLSKIESQLSKLSTFANIVFFSDFPGLHLDSYVSHDIENATIEVLQGEVVLVLPRKNITLSSGKKAFIPSGTFHSVYTVSDYPSCFFYVYFNTTEYKIFRSGSTKNVNISSADEVMSEHQYKGITEKLAGFLWNKIELFRRSIVMTVKAILSLATQILTSSFSTMLSLV